VLCACAVVRVRLVCVGSCADYACTYKHAWGYIYISPNFLCFEATFSSTKLVLALIEIKALHKVRINEAHPLPFAILNPSLSVVCVCVCVCGGACACAML